MRASGLPSGSAGPIFDFRRTGRRHSTYFVTHTTRPPDIESRSPAEGVWAAPELPLPFLLAWPECPRPRRLHGPARTIELARSRPLGNADSSSTSGLTDERLPTSNEHTARGPACAQPWMRGRRLTRGAQPPLDAISLLLQLVRFRRNWVSGHRGVRRPSCWRPSMWRLGWAISPVVGS